MVGPEPERIACDERRRHAHGRPGARRHTYPAADRPLGAPVAAFWTASTSNVRWYIVPDQSDWLTLVSWLVEQALPAYVPGALIRAGSAAHVDEAFLTAGEAAARSALANLEEQYARDKETLTRQLAEATAAATQVRDGLLYGSGGELVQAVQTVLEAAGFEVHDLDTELGGTVSADLLAVLGDSRCLVEVKSVTGDAGERQAGDLQRHLSTWSGLQPLQQPVTCGALVVNHQTRRAPGERASQVYTRAEFVSSLQFPVLPALQLLKWWLASDWPAIKSALLQAEPHARPARPSLTSHKRSPARNRCSADYCAGGQAARVRAQSGRTSHEARASHAACVPIVFDCRRVRRQTARVRGARQPAG